MIIQEKNYTYDTETDKMTLKDWTVIQCENVMDDSPEWRAMQEWANKYMDILEWKAKA